MSKRASIKMKQLEEEDPRVMKIADEGNLDIAYLEMLNTLENDTETKDLPDDCEMRQLSCCKDKLFIVTLPAGPRLIV